MVIFNPENILTFNIQHYMNYIKLVLTLTPARKYLSFGERFQLNAQVAKGNFDLSY